MKPGFVGSLLAIWFVMAFVGCASVPRQSAPWALPTQISPYSCQSNFFAQALSRQYPGDYPVKSPEDLVKLETGIRVEIERGAGGEEVTHAHWGAAIRSLTKGKYQFVERAFRSPEEAIREMRSITDGAEAVAGVSVTRIDGEDYPLGHVVTVLNVEDDGTMTLFNSWVKREGLPINESMVVRTRNVDLKSFDGWYLVYRVVPAR